MKQVFGTSIFIILILVSKVHGLFYTNSKENDYPRIGKRFSKLAGNLNQQAWHRDVEPDKYTLDNVIYDRDDGHYQRRNNKHKQSRIAEVIFKMLDSNDDGYISTGEFSSSSFDKALNRIVSPTVRRK